LELDKGFILRADFASVRRGYDQEEVNRHLRDIAQAVEELKAESRQEKAAPTAQSGSLGSTAAKQVRTIVEAAERSAAEIEATATEEADRVTGEATREAEQVRSKARGEADRVRREAAEAASEIRERAEAEAAQHVAGVEEATAAMRARADTVESDLTGLVDQVRTMVESLVESVRASAGSVDLELASIQSGLAEVREAEPVPEPEPAVEAAEADAVADEVAAADQPTAEHAADVGDDELAAHPDDQEPDEPEAVVEVEDESETAEDAKPEDAEPVPASGGESAEGARLIALNMALNGTPRDETARYLHENFDLEDQDTILDEVYARAGG